MNKRTFFRAVPVMAVCILLCGIGECVIEPPGPEGAGPGDNLYTCNPETGVAFDRNEAWFSDSTGEKLGGYVYAPSCAERTEEAAVVFFFHAGAAEKEDLYAGFCRHLAGKGYIVIAPHYHRPPVFGEVPALFQQVPAEWITAGIAGARKGVLYYREQLIGSRNVPAPMVEQGALVYGAVGHSFGGAVAAALANPTFREGVLGAEDFGSNPKAVVMIMSGQVGDLFPRCPGALDLVYCCPTCPLGWLFGWALKIPNGYGDPAWSPDPDICTYGEYREDEDGQYCLATDGSHLSGDLSCIADNPLWIVMSGEEDPYAGETASLQAYCRATEVTDKHYLRVPADDHGEPFTNDLKGDHWDPAEATLVPLVWTGKVDAHDYWAYRKVVTAAMNCVIHDRDCDYARGGTDEQLGMGYWSDGEPVKRMQYNPAVWDHRGRCFDLETACEMVNRIDEHAGTGESCWKWRGGDARGLPTSCPLQVRLVIRGEGSGTVTHSLNSTESCTTATSPCTWNFDAHATTTTLTAMPDPGSTFSGWGDECVAAPCTGASCNITVDGQVHAIATFDTP